MNFAAVQYGDFRCEECGKEFHSNKALFAHMKAHKKPVFSVVKPSSDMDSEEIENKLQVLKKQVSNLASQLEAEKEKNKMSGSSLQGFSQIDLAGTVDKQVAERMEKFEQKYRIKELEKQVADKDLLIKKLEKEIADLETENDNFSDQITELESKVEQVDNVEHKLERYTAPVLSGLAKAFPALQPKIEGLIQNNLLGGGGLGETPLSEDDRQGLEFARDLRRKFSGEEQDKIVQLLTILYQDKNLLNHTLNVTQQIIQQQQQQAQSQPTGDGGN